MPGTIRPLTPSRKIHGRAFTIHARAVEAVPPEPYKLEIEAVDAAREGDVLISDVDNDATCGFWGELMTTACLCKKVNGALLNGSIRDSWKLNELEFPVFGMGYHPADSKGRVDIDRIRQPITIGGVLIRQGDYVLGDQDGAVIIPQEVALEVVKRAKEKVSRENVVRDALEAGETLGEVFRRYQTL